MISPAKFQPPNPSITASNCIPHILGIWWPEIISNQELQERTGQSDINVEIKRRKYGWIGHTLRKSENEICHSALEWNPQGKRSRGCPKATWRRTVKNVGESLLANYELKPTTVYDGGSLWTAYVPDGIWRICMYVCNCIPRFWSFQRYV